MKRKLGNNSVTAREKNIALIIKLLNIYNVCSRANLAKETGLTQASITYITKELIDRGVIRETGIIESGNHHPSIGLSISPDKYVLMGIQINRDYIHIGLFTLDGKAIDKKTIRYDKPELPGIMVSDMLACMDDIIQNMPAEMILIGGGAALPGPFIPNLGKIELMSGAPDWSEIDISKCITDKYNIPFILEHDANCGALAELWKGNVNEKQDILFVNIADGIGAGIICDGKLYRGQIGTAGEIGHMSINFSGPRCECGNRGCLEMYCSLKKLKRDYDEILFEQGKEIVQPVTSDEILILASRKDPTACMALEKSVSYLGFGLASIVNILNSGTIILADQFAKAGDTLIELTSKHMKKYLLKPLAESVEIRLVSDTSDSFIMRGATIAILEQLLKNPTSIFNK